MFYKIVKDGKIAGVSDRLLFVKFQKKHGVMLLCDKSEAQAIVSPDGEKFWRADWMFKLPKEFKGECETVHIERIDENEYRQLKTLDMKTPEEIIDEYTLWLIDGGLL